MCRQRIAESEAASCACAPEDERAARVRYLFFLLSAYGERSDCQRVQPEVAGSMTGSAIRVRELGRPFERARALPHPSLLSASGKKGRHQSSGSTFTKAWAWFEPTQNDTGVVELST